MYSTQEYQEQHDRLVAASFTEDQARAIMLHVEDRQTKSIGELATKRQLADVELVLRSDMEKMETSIRSDMEKMETSLRHEITSVRTELKHEISDVKKDLSHRMSLQFIALAILIIVGPDNIQAILGKLFGLIS